MSNLLEFALGGNPQGWDMTTLPSGAMTEGDFVWTFTRRIHSRYMILPERSDDLLAWSAGGFHAIPILNDSLYEPDEHVNILLSNPRGLSVLGTPNIATLTITSDDTQLDEWRASKFTPEEQADSTISGLLADPDHNGITNRIEYAANRDPKGADQRPVLALSNTHSNIDGQDYLTATYTREKPRATPLHVEVSADHVTWNEGSAYTEGTQVTADGNGITETVAVRAASPTTAGSRLFVRLRITQP